MRHALVAVVISGSFIAGAPCFAEDEPSVWHPPVLTAVPHRANPAGPRQGLPPRMLALQAKGSDPDRRVVLAAEHVEGKLRLDVRWDDADEDRGADDASSDAVRVTFGDGFDAGGGARLSATAPLAFVARTGAATGTWKDGRWQVTLERPLGGAREAALRVDVVEAGGAKFTTPWARLVVGADVAWDDFGHAELGSNGGFTTLVGGKGAPSAWAVRELDGSKALVQESTDETQQRFPLALLPKLSARDVDVSVAFRALDGFQDRAAGIVWRAKDAANFYVARVNTLERNVVLYKMKDNLRVDIAPLGREGDYGAAVKVGEGWHVLRAVARGDRMQVYVDGVRCFDVVDATFPDAGSVGVWTKADSVTAFDDLLAVSLDAPAAGAK